MIITRGGNNTSRPLVIAVIFPWAYNVGRWRYRDRRLSVVKNLQSPRRRQAILVLGRRSSRTYTKYVRDKRVESSRNQEPRTKNSEPREQERSRYLLLYQPPRRVLLISYAREPAVAMYVPPLHACLLNFSFGPASPPAILNSDSQFSDDKFRKISVDWWLPTFCI